MQTIRLDIPLSRVKELEQLGCNDIPALLVDSLVLAYRYEVPYTPSALSRPFKGSRVIYRIDLPPAVICWLLDFHDQGVKPTDAAYFYFDLGIAAEAAGIA